MNKKVSKVNTRAIIFIASRPSYLIVKGGLTQTLKSITYINLLMDKMEYNMWKWLGAEDLRKTSTSNRMKRLEKKLTKKIQFERMDLLKLLNDVY